MIKIPFYLVDSVETNNFNDPRMLEKIQNIWQMAGRKLSGYEGNVYGLYHNYSGNYKGNYTLSIATDSQYFKNGTAPLLAEGNYAVFKVQDNLKENLVTEWQKIWTLEEENQIHRRYLLDFEQYLPDGGIEIYIGVV